MAYSAPALQKSFLRRTMDGFHNFVASLGLNADNQFSQGQYVLGPYTSRFRIQLEAMYRGNWVAGQVVDTIAEDMTRAGAEIVSLQTPEQTKKINKAIGELKLWKAQCDCLKWSRLYGGAVGFIMISGQNPATPLRLESIAPEQFRGVYVYDRWQIWPSQSQTITELGPDLGQPEFYKVVYGGAPLNGQDIHHSRCIRFDGIELPYQQKFTENGWGESVIERLHDRLVAFDSVSQGAAQLVFKAHLRGVGVKGLREALSAGEAAEAAVIKQFEYIRKMQTNEGLTLLDADDEFWTHQYTFSGLSDIILQFGQQISGATGIPLVRLFGQSPAGLNSTGESDLRNYYDNINKLQEVHLRPAWAQKLYPILSMSVLGTPLPDDFEFTFNPLWQLQDKEKVDLAKGIGETVANLKNSGIISQQMALKELKQSSRLTGVFSNISDEDIEKADDEIQDFADLPGFGDGDQNDFNDFNDGDKKKQSSDKGGES